MSDWSKAPWPTAAAFLEDHGIDPNTILADNVDEFGYERIIRYPNGRAKFVNGRIATEWIEWPSEQFGIDVMDAIWKDEGLK